MPASFVARAGVQQRQESNSPARGEQPIGRGVLDEGVTNADFRGNVNAGVVNEEIINAGVEVADTGVVDKKVASGPAHAGVKHK